MIAPVVPTPQARRALLVGLAYALAAAIWIVATDWLLGLGANSAHAASGSAARDFLLVAITSLALYFLLLNSTGLGHKLANQSRKRNLGMDLSGDDPGADGAGPKRAETAVSESEQRFQSMARNIPGVVYQLRVKPDNAYRLDYLSPRISEIFGIDPRLEGAPWSDLGALVHVDDRAAFLDSINEAITRRADWQFEGRLAYVGAGQKWFQGLSSPMADGDDLIFHGVFLDITERKKAEEQLRKLSLAVEQSPVSVVITDREGAIEYVNPRFTKLTGYTLEEALGQNPRILKSGYTPDEAYREMWEHITAGHNWNGEFLNKKKNGELYWESVAVSAVCDAHGTVTHFVAVKENITDRKRSEAALLESEQRLRLALKAASAGVWEWDVATDRTVWTDENARILGYTPGKVEASFDNWLAAIHPGDRGAVSAELDRVLIQKREFLMEYRIQRPDGTIRWVRDAGNLHLDDQGRPQRMLGILIDVTERKQVEKALEEEATRRRILVDQSLDGIVVLNENGKVYEANKRYAEMLGYSAEEICQLHVWDWDTLWSPEQLLEMLRQIDEGGLQIETRHSRKNGTLLDVEISASAAQIGGQKLVFCICRDTSQRKQAEQALRQSQERFQRALENIPDVVGLHDCNLKIQYINTASRRLTRRPASDCTGASDEESWPSEIREAFLPILRDALQSRAVRTTESEISLPGQELLYLRTTCVPLTDDEGDVREILSITHDLSLSKAREREIERLNRLYATLCRLNQSIVGVRSRDELYREVCQITVAHAGFRLVWLGWHDRETHEVIPIACAGEGVDYLEQIRLYADDRPEGRGPAGLCIRSGKPCIVDDLVQELSASPWRESAIFHGLLSVAALPIQTNGEVSAVFLVYAGEKGVFRDKEVALLQEAASTISFALNHLEQEDKRRQTEDLLRKREAQYRAVIETSPDGFSMCDAENHFLEVNDAYVRRSGYSRDELLSMCVPDVLAVETPEDVAHRCARIRHEGSALFEVLHRSKDGTVWPGEVSVAYWPEGGGRYLTFVRDVHRRNRSEALLRTRLELSDLAARSSLDDLLRAALDAAQLYTGSRFGILHFVDAEQQAFTLQAHSAGSGDVTCPEELLVKPLPISRAGVWADCYHNRQPVIHNNFGAQSQSGLPSFAAPIVRYLSVPVIRHGQVTAILGVGNKTSNYQQDDVEVLSELASMVIDLVARKQAEARMNLLVTALEASASAIVISKPDGVIEWANPAFSFMTGYSLEEVVGRTRADLGEAGVQNGSLFAALRETAGARRVWRGEFINQRKNGSLHYEEMTLTPVADETGVIRHFVAVEQDITERKKSEEAMRQQIELQEQFAKVAASVPGVVYAFRLRPDGTSCIPFAVPTIEDLFGIPRELLAKDATPIFDNIHPDDQQRTLKTIEEASHLPSPWHDVYRYIHPVQGERWVEGWSAPQVEADGSILWHGFVMDVTERKRDEAQIQSLNTSLERRVAERTAELESMLAHATIGLAFFDRDIRYVRINNCLAQMNGISVAEHIGRPLRDVLPAIAETVEPILRRVFDTGEPVAEMEVEGTTSARPTERRFWLESIYPIPGPDGTVISVGAAVTDITERKRGEATLAKLNRILQQEIAERKRVEQQVQRLAAVLEASPDFVAMADPDGRVSYLNKAFSEALGRSPDSEPLTILDCHPEQAYRVIRDEGLPAAACHGVWSGETELLTHQGRSIPVSQLILGHSSPEGKLEFYSTIMRDITQRKQMELDLRKRGQELMAANTELAGAARLKDEFLASMSHELRTPLNGILCMSEGLQELVYGTLNEHQLSAVKDVEECGRHLLELINDILDVAKIEAGKIDLQLAPVLVRNVCQASLRLIKEAASKKRITVLLQLGNLNMTLNVDERRLKQVLVNLLSNAVKFTADGGQVGLEVVADRDQQQVRFTVWDTGIGIRADELQRLFQPFVQLDSRLSRQYEGTGLGLALVKRLTELHGGRVLVDSEPGKGSRFTLLLPGTTLIPEADASVGPDVEENQTVTLATTPEVRAAPLILVIDENSGNARGLMDYLAFKGYRVVVLENPSEVVEMSRKLVPALILLDIPMSETEGLDAIRRFRRDPQLHKVPIVVLTALPMAGNRERSFQAGATEYVRKPVSLVQLHETIDSLLKRE